jgi:hypothetical protein
MCFKVKIQSILDSMCIRVKIRSIPGNILACNLKIRGRSETADLCQRIKLCIKHKSHNNGLITHFSLLHPAKQDKRPPPLSFPPSE